MEFEEITAIWNEIEHRPSERSGFETRLLRGLGVDQVRSRLVGMQVGLAFEIAAAVGAALLTGSYLASQLGDLKFLVPAVVLHLAAMALIIIPTRQLVVLRTMDFSQPVVALQKGLATFRLSRVREGAWMLIVGPLLWTPLAIVMAHGLLGIDIYEGFGVPWVIANLGFGAVVLLGAIWASHRYGDRIGGSRLWRFISDGLAGRSLVAAQGFLADVATFESDD